MMNQLDVTFKAEVPGACWICSQPIYVGDVIAQKAIGANLVAVHAACDPNLSIDRGVPEGGQ